MNWELITLTEEFAPGTGLPVFRHIMRNDKGVSIEGTGAYGKGRSLLFKYIDNKLEFKFWVSNADKEVRWTETADLYVIGPVCEVTIYKSDFPRAITSGEGLDIRGNIESFFLNYSKYPMTVPPFPERVEFDKFAKEVLKPNQPN